jgi:uncharacterized protein (TIGR00661 family)
MRVLYAIQGTGNGHLSRANEIVPLLKRKIPTDVLISGTQNSLPVQFNVDHRFNGLSFVSGKSGGVDLMGTWSQTDTRRLHKEISQFPIHRYDLVITDFEPVSAWAARLNNVPCVELSHQAAVLNRKSPKPNTASILGKLILGNYCPSNHKYGFHFDQYDSSIYTPVIRSEIRNSTPLNMGHYTVYLPAFSLEYIQSILSIFDGIRWQIFTKETKEFYRLGNMEIYPISSEGFTNSMINSQGVLCGAGFETPSEALYLRKKLMVIPMKNQYEQQCNAEALERLGVKVIPTLSDRYLSTINDWIQINEWVYVEYPDQTEMILEEILDVHLYGKLSSVMDRSLLLELLD